MLQSKFIKLYQTITESERRLLKKWIYSPIHNQHEDIQQLFEYLFSRDGLTEITLKKERAFAYVFPKEEYDMYRLNHLMSYALEVLEEFIEYLEGVSNKIEANKNKIKAYSKRNLTKMAQQTLQRGRKALSKNEHQHAAFYYNAYQLEELAFELEGVQQRTKENNLPKLFQHLSDFFVITTLKYACTAATHQNVYKTSYDIPMLEAVLEQAQQKTASPVAQLYYFAYQSLMSTTEEDFYQALKNSFEQYGALLPPKERQEILLIAINYAIKRSHTGEVFYIQEALDLYKKGLESRLLIENRQLSRFAYKNIVALGLKLEEFDWTAQFIQQYSVFLAATVRQNYLDYVTAKLHFAKRAYDACMQLLIQVEYDDLFMNIDAKMMLLKIYYENQSLDALEALTQSFTQFLNRKEVLSYHKKNYLNIIRLTQKILTIPSFDTASRKKLEIEIKETNPLTERAWLLEQLLRVSQ